jgi:hypothetical protein
MDHPGMSMDPDASLGGALANMRLRYLLDSNDWTGEIASWPQPKNAGPGARLDYAFARALGEIRQGHRDAARLALSEIETVGREVADIKNRSGDPDPTYRVRPEIFLLEARALQAEQEGDSASAERLILQAVALEDKLPIAFGPPTIDKPSHELLGEFLLRRGRKVEAHARAPPDRAGIRGNCRQQVCPGSAVIKESQVETLTGGGGTPESKSKAI